MRSSRDRPVIRHRRVGGSTGWINETVQISTIESKAFMSWVGNTAGNVYNPISIVGSEKMVNFGRVFLPFSMKAWRSTLISVPTFSFCSLKTVLNVSERSRALLACESFYFNISNKTFVSTSSKSLLFFLCLSKVGVANCFKTWNGLVGVITIFEEGKQTLKLRVFWAAVAPHVVNWCISCFCLHW